MAGVDSSYSRAVIAAKLILPLIAVAILSTLFLLARQAPQGEPLQFVDSEVEALAETQQLGAPRHAAVSEDGTGIDMTADKVWTDPDQAEITRGEAIDGIFSAEDGFVYDIVAARGHSNETEDVSFLEGGVTIRTSDGYRLRTAAMRVRNDRTYLTSLAPIQGDGPLGTIDAGRMEIFATPGADDRTHVVFSDGVRVYHTP